MPIAYRILASLKNPGVPNQCQGSTIHANGDVFASRISNHLPQ